MEILKALLGDCRVLVLDEPTAVLVPADVELLFASIRRLTAQGMAVVFISHKLHEVVDLADRIGILRRGRLVADLPAEGLDPAAIAALMVGPRRRPRSRTRRWPPRWAWTWVWSSRPPSRRRRPRWPTGPGPRPWRSVHHPGRRPPPAGGRRLADRRAGEIVGVAGVSGNGQTELVALLCGTTPVTAGTVHVGGSDIGWTWPPGCAPGWAG